MPHRPAALPGDSAEQQIAGHLTLDPTKPCSLNPAIPAGFDAVIARGMAKDPDRRYQTALELAAAAEAAVTEPISVRSVDAACPSFSRAAWAGSSLLTPA